ncbi:MAG TPA: RT0821/Lpp0805 family surface protein [Gammaproteobacteria bacterium]|nr:RT0821/Lpp0805 family surface protein [Gammaproteobacteria bacterium]
MRTNVKTTFPALALVVAACSATALAQPPAHAPAHGWRAKQGRHVSHAGYRWETDFGISAGNCDRQKIATVVGGVAGGYIANRVAEPDNRLIATIIGAAAGALIGNRIGKELDEADQACVGHALELGTTGRPVSWANESTGVYYRLSPGETRQVNGEDCREFSLLATSGSRRSSKQGIACQSARGAWEVIG